MNNFISMIESALKEKWVVVLELQYKANSLSIEFTLDEVSVYNNIITLYGDNGFYSCDINNGYLGDDGEFIFEDEQFIMSISFKK